MPNPGNPASDSHWDAVANADFQTWAQICKWVDLKGLDSDTAESLCCWRVIEVYP